MRALLAVFFVLALLTGGACGSDDDGGDEASSATDDTTDVTIDETTDESADDPAGGEGRAAVVDALSSQGVPERLAGCIVDEVLAAGYETEDLESELGAPDQDLIDALGRAGAACATPEGLEDLQDVPLDGIDLSDPIVRDQFVKNFAAASGLSTEVAGCVADQLVASDFSLSRLSDVTDPEVGAIVDDAVAACS